MSSNKLTTDNTVKGYGWHEGRWYMVKWWTRWLAAVNTTPDKGLIVISADCKTFWFSFWYFAGKPPTVTLPYCIHRTVSNKPTEGLTTIYRHRFSCHVTELASRIPSVLQSLLTRGQAKAAAADNNTSPPPSPLTPVPLSATSSSSPPLLPPQHHVPVDLGSSNNNTPVHPSYTAPRSMSKAAMVEVVSGKLLVLLKGKCSQAVLRQFEVAFANYCTVKAITTDKTQMAIAVGCFRDHKITDWLEIKANRKKVLAMSFKGFMAKLRKWVLPQNWERNTRLARNQCYQGPNKTFLDFQTAVHAQNSHLANTAFFLKDNRLRELLETHMLFELQEDYADNLKAKDETVFGSWLEELDHIDQACIRQNGRLHAIAKQQPNHNCKRNATNDGGNDCPLKRNRRDSAPNSTLGSTTNTTSTANGRGSCCPKLTPAEANLLNANHSCCRCQKPFQTHTHDHISTKACSFPLATNYKSVTQAMINAALTALTADGRCHFSLPPAPAPTPKPPVAVMLHNVATVIPDIDDPNDSLSTDGDLSNRVSRSHRTLHLFWEFLLEGPMTNLPVPICGLIDDGCHLVLIKPKLVDRLSLGKFKLHEPEEIGVAVDDPDAKPLLLFEYVKLRTLSKELSWESNTVCAIIAPDLCIDILLGLPWLERNHIVIDHHVRTVVDKRCNYNLLDPAPSPPPPPPHLKLREKLKQTNTNYKPLAAELKAVCAAHLKRMTSERAFEPVKEVDIVAAISDRIEALAELAHYQTLGDNLKSCYRPIFEPIPHVDDLLTVCTVQ
ncbi:hypothetical protein B0H19DRAFT_1081799 [Mycena capillaripes]|nr:hypothetical protein B0H19DRAFT_1081799 [Mycena capillaripes]